MSLKNSKNKINRHSRASENIGKVAFRAHGYYGQAMHEGCLDSRLRENDG